MKSALHSHHFPRASRQPGTASARSLRCWRPRPSWPCCIVPLSLSTPAARRSRWAVWGWLRVVVGQPCGRHQSAGARATGLPRLSAKPKAGGILQRRLNHIPPACVPFAGDDERDSASSLWCAAPRAAAGAGGAASNGGCVMLWLIGARGASCTMLTLAVCKQSIIAGPASGDFQPIFQLPSPFFKLFSTLQQTMCYSSFFDACQMQPACAGTDSRQRLCWDSMLPLPHHAGSLPEPTCAAPGRQKWHGTQRLKDACQ